MEQAVRVFEEQRSEHRNGDGDILEISDFDESADMFFVSILYWQFYKDAVGEDLSGIKTFDIDGKNIEMSEAEARLLAYLATGHGIKVAYLGDVLAGFLIFQPIFENLIVNKIIFVEKWARNLKLAKKLINSVQRNPKKIIFKTLKSIVPKELLDHAGEERLTKISEDDHSNTWLIDWVGE